MSVQRISGQPGLRRVSPLVALLIMALLVVVVLLVVVFAVVMIPVLIVVGVCFALYRGVKRFARAKTNRVLNRDDAGRQNVRVLRSSPEGDGTL